MHGFATMDPYGLSGPKKKKKQKAKTPTGGGAVDPFADDGGDLVLTSSGRSSAELRSARQAKRRGRPLDSGGDRRADLRARRIDKRQGRSMPIGGVGPLAPGVVVDDATLDTAERSADARDQRAAAKAQNQVRRLLKRLQSASGRQANDIRAQLAALRRKYANVLGADLLAQIDAALAMVDAEPIDTDTSIPDGIVIDDDYGGYVTDPFGGEFDDGTYPGVTEPLPDDLQAIFDRMNDIEGLLALGGGKGKKGGKGSKKFKQILKNVKFIMGDVNRAAKGAVIATGGSAASKGRGSKALGQGSTGSFGRSRYVGEGAMAAFGRSRFLGPGATGYFGHSGAGGAQDYLDDSLLQELFPDEYYDDGGFYPEDGLYTDDGYYFGNDGLDVDDLFFDDAPGYGYAGPVYDDGSGVLFPDYGYDDGFYGSDPFDNYGWVPTDPLENWEPGGTLTGSPTDDVDYGFDPFYGDEIVQTDWDGGWDYGSATGTILPDEIDAQEAYGLLEEQLGDLASLLQERLLPAVAKLDSAARQSGDGELRRRAAAARYAVEVAAAHHAQGVGELACMQADGDGLGNPMLIIGGLRKLAMTTAGAVAGVAATVAVTGGAGMYASGKQIGESVGTGLKWGLGIAIPLVGAVLVADRMLRR